jgi:phosphohistidine phosphatase
VHDDWDRSLSKHGKKNVLKLGEIFKEKNLTPHIILSSAANRARETCELLVDAIRYRGDVYFLSCLYMGEADTYLKEIRKLPDDVDCALVIGHNPGVQTLYQMLSWDIGSLQSTTVACIQIPIDTWKELDFNCTSDGFNLWELSEDVVHAEG